MAAKNGIPIISNGIIIWSLPMLGQRLFSCQNALYHVQAKNDYWENEGESLTDLIHKYRWYILKDALMQRGRDAVTDFIGTDISSSEFSRVLDETEMVMPDETFEKFWEKYI